MVTPETCRLLKIPTDVMPEYVPESLALGTIPEDKLDAFKFVKLEPSPIKYPAVATPETFKFPKVAVEVMLITFA